jgi:subtilisin family serine protease
MKRIILFVAALHLALLYAHAEQVECISGEYVLTTGTNSFMKREAVEAVESASRSDFDIAESTQQTVLITEESLDAASDEEEIVSYDAQDDVCKKLKSAERDTLRARVRGATIPPPRRFSCSCNAVVKATYTPNDMHYGLQWGLHQSSDIDMNLPAAWDLSRGSKMVVVAVIDTGVETTHADLSGNTDWRNWGEYGVPNGIDDDGNGYIDDINGFNAINNSGNATDDNGHGTHVAGTIGAVTNNYTGVAGVMPGVRILPVKFLDSRGQGALFNAIKAIDYVTDMAQRAKAAGWEHEIVATNNSWGGGGYLSTMYDAINRARSAGILFIAAAGNEANNNDSNPSYPSAYDIDNIISVAAIDRNGNLASFSNYGAQNVDIAAPGDTIASTYTGGRYMYLSGTSMATPHVSGAVGLLKAYSKNLTWQAIRAAVLTSGKPLSSLQGRVATGAYLDAYALLSRVSANPMRWDWDAGHQYPAPGNPAQATPTPTPTPTATPPSQVAISGKVSLMGQGAFMGARVELTINQQKITQYTGALGEFNFTGLTPGIYTLTASARGVSFSSQQLDARYNSITGFSLAGTLRPAVLTALVINAQRQPMAGINVIMQGQQYTTGQNGRVYITEAFGESYSITAAPEGYLVDTPTLTGTLYGDTTRVFVVQQE